MAALEPLATDVSLSSLALARGIVRISTTKIMGAVRSITVEVGRDPKDFALLAFGGGGGLVAVDVAHELGIPTVIVPPGQGAFSAFGMLMADVQHDFSRTAVFPLADLDAARLAVVYDPMTEEARGLLTAEGFGPAAQVLTRAVDVRYAGQEHTVTVPVPDATASVAGAVERAFSELHERQYGHTMDDPIEVTTMRLRATGVVGKPTLPRLESRAGGTPRSDGTRPVYLSEEQPSVAYTLYTRESLLAGDEIDGPAVISEHTATTVIHAGDRLRVGEYGEMVITVSTESKA
jgi:N-methylhydantoinase A